MSKRTHYEGGRFDSHLDTAVAGHIAAADTVAAHMRAAGRMKVAAENIAVRLAGREVADRIEENHHIDVGLGSRLDYMPSSECVEKRV